MKGFRNHHYSFIEYKDSHSEWHNIYQHYARNYKCKYCDFVIIAMTIAILTITMALAFYIRHKIGYFEAIIIAFIGVIALFVYGYYHQFILSRISAFFKTLYFFGYPKTLFKLPINIFKFK